MPTTSPTLAPTASPTTSPTVCGPVMDNRDELRVAVESWTSDKQSAEDKYCPINEWDVSRVTSMLGVFKDRKNFDEDIGAWDTSMVTDMKNAFLNAEAFDEAIDAWDTSNVATMNQMFDGAAAFNQPIGNWDTSRVTDMRKAFHAAPRFDEAIRGWDTSKVEDMHGVFLDATAFNQPIGAWDTSRVVDMSAAFYKAAAFDGDVGDWDASAVTTMKNAFHAAAAFDVDIGAWDTSNVVMMDQLFDGATVFDQPIGAWDTSKVADLRKAFYDAPEFNQDIGDWDVSSAADVTQMFDGADAFKQCLPWHEDRRSATLCRLHTYEYKWHKNQFIGEAVAVASVPGTRRRVALFGGDGLGPSSAGGVVALYANEAGVWADAVYQPSAGTPTLSVLLRSRGGTENGEKLGSAVAASVASDGVARAVVSATVKQRVYVYESGDYGATWAAPLETLEAPETAEAPGPQARNFGNAVAIDGDWLLIGGWLDTNESPLTDVNAEFKDVEGRHCDYFTPKLFPKRYCNQQNCGGSGYNNNIERMCDTYTNPEDCPGHSKAKCMEECVKEECGAIYWDAVHGCGLYDKCLPTGIGNLGTAFSVRGTGSGNACDVAAENAGAVYVYQRDATSKTWIFRQKLLAPTSPPNYEWCGRRVNYNFGASVAIDGVGAGGGGLVAVGAINRAPEIPFADKYGSVFVYGRDGLGDFELRVRLDEGSGSQDVDWFGYSVSLSGDLLAVGAPRAFRLDNPDDGRGAAYVFRTGDGGETWTQTGLFAKRYDGCSNFDTDTDPLEPKFGRSVSVGGSVVVVSDEDHDHDAAAKGGAACVYRTTDGGDTWFYSTTLMLDAPATGDGFAGALRSNVETRVGANSVSTDGSVAVAGAYRRDVPNGGTDAGGGYVFRV